MLTSLLSLPSRLLRPAARRRSPAPRRTLLGVELLELRDTPSVTIAPTTLPNPKAGASYSQTLTGSGGTSPFTFKLTSGSLPGGLSLDSSSGAISGTPTAAGSFTFTVQAADNSSPAQTGSQSYTFTVGAPTLTLSPTKLTSSATVGKSYTQTITAGGGTTAYHFTVSSGALPAGLTLSDAGTISGKPTAAGAFSFTIKATDSTTGTGSPFSKSQSYSLSVKAPTIILNPRGLGRVVAGASFTTKTITATGGTASYKYSVSKSNLPSDLKVSTTNGVVISGPTDAVGTFTFTVTATDSSTGTGAPFTGSHSYTLTVNPAKLVFLVQPGDAAVGANLATFTVEALDQSGKVVSGQVTLRLVPVVTEAAGAFKSGGRTMTGTLAKGVATFSTVAITARGRYALKATIGSLSVSSDSFDIGLNGRHSP